MAWPKGYSDADAALLGGPKTEARWRGGSPRLGA